MITDTGHALFLTNSEHNSIQQIQKGIEAYIQRHELEWSIQRLRRNENWRIHDYLRLPNRICAVAGILGGKFVSEVEVYGDRVTILSPSVTSQSPQTYVVEPDDYSIGQQAIDHLLMQGYRNIATWGDWNVPKRSERFIAVEEKCKKNGVVFFKVSRKDIIGEFINSSVSNQEGYIRKYLTDLPRPLGIFTHQDCDARYLRNLLTASNLRIPDDFGILGVDDNPALCEECHPSLSSVRIPWTIIGKRFAEIWHGIISGSTPNQRYQCIPAYGITTRDSTNLAFHHQADPTTHQFLQIIEKSFKDTCSISKIAAQMDISPATMLRRVTAAVGRSPRDLLHDRRIRHASELLRNTSDDLTTIAKHCGYSSPQRLHEAFIKRFPIPPGKWRHH